MLFGQKSSFAIEVEYEDKSRDFGRIRLWLDGRSLGTLEETQMIGVTIHQLKRILETKKSKELPSFSSNADLFNYLMDEQEDVSLVSFGEAFDDFSIFCICTDDSLVFVYKLEQEPFFEYGDFGHDVASYSANRLEVKAAVDEFLQS